MSPNKNIFEPLLLQLSVCFAVFNWCINPDFCPITKQAFATHKALVKLKSDLIAPLEWGEQTLKNMMVEWDDEQEKIRKQAEIEAQKKAMEEEEERLKIEAEAAMEAGDLETAEALLSEKVEAPPVVVEKATPKHEGVTFVPISKENA